MSRYGEPGGSGILHSSYSGLLVALLKENKRDFPNDRDPTKFVRATYPLVSLTGFSVAAVSFKLIAPVHLATTIASIVRQIASIVRQTPRTLGLQIKGFSSNKRCSRQARGVITSLVSKGPACSSVSP